MKGDTLTDAFIAEHGRPDVTIIDPPRAGMHQDVVDTILRAEPATLVYVSCNPATQARDIALLDADMKSWPFSLWICSLIPIMRGKCGETHIAQVTASKNFSMNILIIVAMQKEMNLLLPLLENDKEITEGGRTYHCGNIGGHRVSLAKVRNRKG